jgi:hypothetical protein
MGIPRSHRQETLHKAYVSAVVAIAGLKLTWGDPEYGVDCSNPTLTATSTFEPVSQNRPY